MCKFADEILTIEERQRRNHSKAYCKHIGKIAGYSFYCTRELNHGGPHIRHKTDGGSLNIFLPLIWANTDV